MRVPSFTVLRVLTALCLLPAVACGEPPDENPTTAALFASAARTNVTVGASTTILVNSVKAGGDFGSNNITATVNDVEIGSISLDAAIAGGSTATTTPDAGRATFHFTCDAVGEAVITFETASGADVVKATETISCLAARSPRLITLNTAACATLQADGVSNCEVVATVKDTTGAVVSDLPLSVSVASAVTPDGAESAEKAALRIESTAPLAATLTITTNAAGQARFTVASSAIDFIVDLTLAAIDADGNKAEKVVPIVAKLDSSDLLLTTTNTEVGAGQAISLKVAALNGDGTAARGRTVDVTLVRGTLVAADCAAVVNGLGVLTLDDDGECEFEVTAAATGAEPVKIDVRFEPSPFEPITKTTTVTITPPGQISVTTTPPTATISANGTGSETVSPTSVELVIEAKKDGGAATSTVITAVISSASRNLIKFESASVGGDALEAGVTATSVEVTNAADGELRVVVVAENPAALGNATVVVTARDTLTNISKENNVAIRVDRELELRSLIFKAFEPSGVIGVRGSSLSSSTTAVFQLLDERNQPVGNKNISFEALSSTQGVTVIPTGATDQGGLVSTVVSAGTVAGPITVRATVIEKPELTTPSSPISVVGGLPNSALSSFVCSTKAAFDPFTTDCSASLVDRFTNPASEALNVQFRAEGGNINAFSTASGGLAAATFVFSEPGPGSADVLEWSYSSVRPTSPTSALRAAFAGCFDQTTRSSCDLIAICDSDDSQVNAFCPLRPTKILQQRDTATCVADISPEAREALDQGGTLATFADWEFAVFEERDLEARAQFLAYQKESRACGYPISCLTGEGGLGLLGDPADDCPVNLGCLDFTAATECPQDGLLDVLAAVRGEEAFDDQNGNGVRDNTDTLVESFIDYPEPFLDKNSSCSFDDINGLERQPENEQVRLSDLFIDTDPPGQGGTFGFGRPGSELETNGAFDLNTELTLKTTVVHLAGRPVLDFGELLRNPTACGVNGATPVLCQQRATGAFVNANSRCTENARTALGGGALLEGCLPLSTTFRDGDTVILGFRWKDANGNCPTADFAGTPTVTVEGPAKVLANDEAYTQGECGAAPGAINASNIERPWCEEHAAMGAPIRTFSLEADCGADDVGPKPVKITFELDGTTVVRTVFVGCPVCGDNVREGDEECDDGDTTSGDGCDATCVIET